MSETNTQLDIRIAKACWPKRVVYEQFDKCRVQVPDGDDFYFTPCSDWNQLMPLVIENHIGFDPLPVDNSMPTAWSNVVALINENMSHQRAMAELLADILDEMVRSDL